MYKYNAVVTRVVDGDTFDAEVDVGFSITIKHRFRLEDIDTPETWRPKTAAEREHGTRATEYVKKCIEGKQVILITSYLGIYGRYTASVEFQDNAGEWFRLRQCLIDNNFEKRTDYSDD